MLQSRMVPPPPPPKKKNWVESPSIDYSTTGLVAAVIDRVTDKVAPSAFCSCNVLSQAVL